MSKSKDRVEIDFEDGVSKETLQTRVNLFAERLRILKNPYTGNKRKLLIYIFSSIEKQGWEYNSFLDLFSGSGMVGATARYLGKNVIANDIMKYAYYNAKYLLHSDAELTDNDIQLIYKYAENEKCEPKDFVRKHYPQRFTPEEALWLDRLYFSINMIFPCCIRSGLRSDYVQAMLGILHYVMDHCFVGGRLNNGQVLADMDHRLAHQRNQGKSMSFRDIEWLKPFTGPNGKNVAERDGKNYGTAFNMDAIELLQYLNQHSLPVDLCYIDPPYGSDQSDYLHMYSFFEEYITQTPLSEMDTQMGAARFVSTRTYDRQFADLLDACRKIPKLVLSYNDSSWCKIDGIVEAIKRAGRKVVVEEVDYPYNYRDKNVPAREFIILAE